MTDNTTPPPEQVSEWAKQKLQDVSRHMAEKGIIPKKYVMEESRYLYPWVTVWKIQGTDGQYYWGIGGDLPSDILPLSAAKDPRAALRHLSLGWQMKAENLRQTLAHDKTQQEFAALLDSKAQLLYEISEQDSIWQQG